VSSRAAQKKHESLNSEAFWNKKAEDVSVDEVFFHRYFSHIGKGKQAASKKKPSAKREGSEDEENEDEIWQALVDSRPEVEGGSDDESDMEMLDLDDSDAPSSIGDDEDEGDSALEGLDEDADDKDLEDDEWDDASDADDVDELFEKELEQAQPPDEKIEEGPRQKKRRLKNLPTFASVEDYAEMLDNDDDEDL
jgi:ribosome biogenesis protein MAK21